MVLGAGTFVPGARFALPRSYWYGVWLSFNSDAVVSWVGNEVTFLDPPSGVTGLIGFEPRAWSWSSNCYTLDFLIVESWYRVPPSPTQNPLPFVLTYFVDPSDGKPYMVYSPFGAVGTGAFKHQAPPPPPGYWRPHWL